MSFDAGLRAIAGSGVVGLCNWTLDSGGAPITDADDVFIAMLGYDREGFARDGPFDWRQLTPPESMSALDERLAELLETGAHAPCAQEIVSRTGHRVAMLVTSAITNAATGAATSICLDLSDQVRARADAERASNAKSRFLAVMTHELRTPLNTIIGQTELVSDGTYGAVTEQQRAALARLRRAGSQLRALVDEVLTFSRLETGVVQYEMCDIVLVDALTAVAPDIRAQAEAKDIAFEVNPPDAALCVRADNAKLYDVLLALLSNAVKFTPSGGRVTLDTAVRDSASEYVFVRVSDTGSGIARERQKAIFEPFTQMDEGKARAATGLGLGLTISRDLAAGMGGNLRVRSTQGEGGGSTFTLSLRRAGPKR
jgi:signal transduction histidine kinase